MLNFKKNKQQNDNFEININQFKTLQNNALLIDVRDEQEFQLLKKIPNCQNIPYRELISNPQKFIPNKETVVITICNAGNRSTAAAQFLQNEGYKKAYVLIGGIYSYFHNK